MTLENNLLNVRIKDPVFLPVARRITEKTLRLLTDEDAKLLLKAYQQIPVIAADNYFLHYSLLPRLRSDDNPDRLLNKVLEAQREYVKSKQYSTVRTVTKLSDTFSTIHAVAFTKTFVEQLLEELRARAPQQYRQLVEQLRQAAQSPQSQPGGGQQSQQPQAQQQPGGQQQTQQQGGQPQQSAQPQGGQQPQQGLGRLLDSNSVGKAFRKAQEEADRAARVARDVSSLFDVGKGPGSLDVLLDLTGSVLEVKGAEKILSLAKKVVDAMPFFVHRKKEKDRRFGDEVAGYYLTKSVGRALPRELALPDDLFYAKLVGPGLLAREKLTVREGALYVLLDKSGSMEGEKTVWARSVALALLALARRKRARFFLRFFDTRVYDLVTDERPPQLLEMLLKVVSNGGTSIDTALRTALEDLHKRDLARLTNTIVLITDGEDKVTVKKEELQRAGARLISVMIQGSNDTLCYLSDHYLRAQLSEHGALRLVEVVR